MCIFPFRRRDGSFRTVALPLLLALCCLLVILYMLHCITQVLELDSLAPTSSADLWKAEAVFADHEKRRAQGSLSGLLIEPSLTAEPADRCALYEIHCWPLSAQRISLMPVMPWLWTSYMYHLRYVMALSMPVYALVRIVTVIPRHREWNWRDDPPLFGGTLATCIGLLSYAWLYRGVGLWQAVLPDLAVWMDVFIGGFWRFACVPIVLRSSLRVG